MGWMKGLLLLLVCVASLRPAFGSTDPQDAAALRSLMNSTKNTPPGWGQTDDPCAKWEGVSCNGLRVTTLKLFSMGLEGILSSDIGSLTELQTLDLSYNPNLGGTLTPAVGNLKKLEFLIMIGCNFSGRIPDELGNLSRLTFLALNSNKFSGKIPASLGKLSNLFWLDLADNQLMGSLPVSTDGASGLDQLFKAEHFHLNKNQFSGPIPEKLFNSNMSIIHVLLDSNQLNGRIPNSIGLVQTLEILRLDNNSLSGSVPSNITNLKNLTVLHLANNNLTGPMPDLTGMDALNYVDLSNNSFDPSEAPPWFSSLQNLTTLVIESGRLHGEVPQKLFSFPRLQEVTLKNNRFNGTLDLSNNISRELRNVDFQNNSLASVTISLNYNHSVILVENPVCSNTLLATTSYCQPLQKLDEQSNQPNCSHPYEGVMIFRAPYFRDMDMDDDKYRSLRDSLWKQLGSKPVKFSLQNFSFTDDSYLRVQLQICPLNGTYFTKGEILLWLNLSSNDYNPPDIFGPFYLNGYPYQFQIRESSRNRGWIIGVTIGCALLILGLVALGIYALRQKKEAQRAIALTNPFASWVSTGEDDGGAPQLKAAKCFTFDELRKYTNNFPDINVIGSGGYGKVYRGILPDGQILAIKRSQQGSTQGGLEFKTEIELLSRVHHKNLVGLVGFCFEKGEQMLVYEFILNGTLRDSLSGNSGIQLDWKRRLRIALDSARGLAYLHELANPPIIHRDVKSTNILLDEKLTAKVADFGLSKLVANSEEGLVSTNVKGTLGYLDPEYYMTHQLTGKSDVYSLGVVMLELISAKPPILNGKYIVREVKTAIDGNDKEYYGLKEIIDPVIKNAGYLTSFRRFVDLAMLCVQDSAVHRPTTSDVVREIETILHNDGLMTSSTSVSSASDLANSYGAVQYFYSDLLPRKDVSSSVSSNAFDYSGGYSLSERPQPK